MMVRLYIWFTPRSRSTALIRCLGHIPRTKVIFEPFNTASMCGPNKVTDAVSPSILPCETEMSFEHVQKLLEDDYPEFDHIIAKDPGVAINGDFSRIPSNFKHVILVRNPVLAMKSTLKLACSQASYEALMEAGNRYSSAFDYYNSVLGIYKYVSESCEYEPLVLDSSMVETNPGETVEKICRFVGLPYDSSILNNWEPVQDFPENWMIWESTKVLNKKFGFFNQVLSSSGLLKHNERHVKHSPLLSNTSSISDNDDLISIYEKMLQLM